MALVKRSTLLFAAGAAACALAGQASAGVVAINLTGTVLDGKDWTGAFGYAPGTSLTNDPFTAVVHVDTSLGATTGSATATTVTGGPGAGTLSPVLDASFTINGVTHSFDTSWSGTVSTSSGLYGSGLSIISLDPANYGVTLYMNGPASTFPNAVAPPLSLDLTQAGFGSSGSRFSLDNEPSVSLTLTSVTETSAVAAVPEPATWAMLVLGVAMVGFAARRREGLAVAA